MKKIAALAFAFLVIPTQEGTAQVTIQDDAKVGLIVTGTGNTINTTQIFGKSPEYAELKKALATLETDIQKKAATCEKMAKDNLPAVYRDGCRSELIALNARRDSVQEVEARFREDVIRLAESFSKMELNSERLRLAKELFDEGKIREADNVLNAREMKMEGDQLLVKKGSQEKALNITDSLLHIKADEFLLKARLKAIDMQYDSAIVYLELSKAYTETSDNLADFAEFLFRQNEIQRSSQYFERALEKSKSEIEEANAATYMGNFYSNRNKLPEAEYFWLKALNIFENLAKRSPKEFESDLAQTAMKLGNFYYTNQKMAEAEKMYLRSLDIRERLAKDNPAQFEPDLALTAVNLGNFYSEVQRMAEAEKMYLRSLKILEVFAKDNPSQFEPDLASTVMNLGIFYYTNQKMAEAEKMFLRSLNIFERLAKDNPIQFEQDLARTAKNLGIFYSDTQKMGEAEKMYLRSLVIYERLAKDNPAQFEQDLESVLECLGIYLEAIQKTVDAELMFLRALEISQRLAKANPARFEPDLARTAMNLGLFYANVQKMAESEKMYLQSLDIFERLAKANPAQFELGLATTALNLGISYQTVQKMAESEKMYLKSLDIFERLAKVNPAQFEPSLAYVLGELSFFYLFVNKYPEAQAAAERAIPLDPTKNFVRTNLGHAYLLRGDWATAKAVYEEYLKNEPDLVEAKKTLAKDWDDLEAAGISCTDIAKARKWVKE